MAIILSKFKYKKYWFHSLRWKLLLSYIFISFVPILLFYNTVLVSMEDTYKGDRRLKIQDSANVIAGNMANYMRGYGTNEEGEPGFNYYFNQKVKENSFRILIFDAKGIVVNDSNQKEIGNMILVPEVIEALQKNNSVKIHSDEMSVYAASVIMSDSSEKLGAVLLVESIEDIYQSLDDISKRLIYFIILIGCILGVLVVFMSQLIIDPLNNIMKSVQKMSDGHLNQRIATGGKDEFSELAASFNKMTEKLEQVDKTREEFVSNVSHELKTPLSSVKVLSESILLQEDVPIATYREFLWDINSEVDRMTDIVNDLLNLVKLDQKVISLNIKPADLNKIVEDILKRLFPLAEQKNIDLIFEDVRKVIIDADAVKISLALSNLVENGIKYTYEGGIVKVIVDADHQNAFVTISDTGIGIGEEDQGKIFNRFYRVDKTRDRETGGTGLGLSITQKTILLHNGSIRLSSKENEGSTFIVRIPIHQSL